MAKQAQKKLAEQNQGLRRSVVVSTCLGSVFGLYRILLRQKPLSPALALIYLALGCLSLLGTTQICFLTPAEDSQGQNLATKHQYMLDCIHLGNIILALSVITDYAPALLIAIPGYILFVAISLIRRLYSLSQARKSK